MAAASLGAQSPVAELVNTFTPIDVDGDGKPELRRLELLAEAGSTEAPLVLVAVERRLLRDLAAEHPAATAALRERLVRHAADVAAAGFRAALVAVEAHAGPPHQDGRTVLGLRRLLQTLHARTGLAGAVLVGHFPDALLVRTCNWRRQEALELPGRDGSPVRIAAATTNVRCVPEYVAHRCDVVLADLDGAWQDVYVPGPASLPSVTAVFGAGELDAGGPCVAMKTGELQVVDVFHVRDGTAAVDREAFAVALDPTDRDRECAAADRALGNPLAVPEVAISRIDARGVAWSPEPRALDAAGRPQAMPLTEGDDRKDVAWSPDAALELRLLCDYFDRNHAFRSSPLPDVQRRPASIAHGLGSGMASLRAASAAWREFAEPGYDCTDGVDLTALLAWLQRPAVLRTLRAHSDPFAAEFHRTDTAALEQAVGGPPWRWRREGHSLVPSLRANAGGRADWSYYRTLWQNGVLPPHPYLLVHTGCEALSPPHANDRAYDDPAYGRFAHAESMLFFTPCLAIVGRAKVFYDEPRGFCDVLAAGGTFGDAWRRYFAVEAAAASWGEVGGDIGRKRAYFWSVVGDWTLRLP